MKNLLLILLPLISFSQDFENIYYNPINSINIMDDSFSEPDQEAYILATKSNSIPYFGIGKILSSFESDSDVDALYEYKWKSDFIIRSGEQRKDALVRGFNGKYYIIRWR
jgi:hypothetical protein